MTLRVAALLALATLAAPATAPAQAQQAALADLAIISASPGPGPHTIAVVLANRGTAPAAFEAQLVLRSDLAGTASILDLPRLAPGQTLDLVLSLPVEPERANELRQTGVRVSLLIIARGTENPAGNQSFFILPPAGQ
jgi:hypothetical protein